MEIECESCGKIMKKEDYPKYSYAQFEARRFCSKKCQWKDETYKQIMRKAVKKANDNMSKSRIDSAKRMGEANKGKHNSSDTEFKFGELNPNWVGGTKKYRGPNWKIQREAALKRDNYICKRCGQNGTVVHHIIPYRISKDSNLDNLITLCSRCHIITERGYSKLLVLGQDIAITHVPQNTLNAFLQLSDEGFNGNTGMCLKWLMDGLISVETAELLNQIEELRTRIERLESVPKTDGLVGRKMLNGKIKKVNSND